MGEKIFEFLKSLATGRNNRVFWGFIILLVIAILIVFPYIDANFLYYSRIEKRIDNLSSLVELSGKPVEKTPALFVEYNSIIGEITNAQDKSISGASSTDDSSFNYWVKLISGGFLFALVGIIGLFQKKKGVKYFIKLFLKNNILMFVLCMLFAAQLSYLFARVPTLGSVWVNAVMAPIIQLIIVYLFFMQPNK